MNDFLTGSNTNLTRVLNTRSTSSRARRQGQRPHLTLAPDAQRVALNALGGNCGAAVALDPKTGARARQRLEPDLRPEPDREPLQPRRRRPKFGCGAAPQPRRRRGSTSPARLQGRHRGGGARSGKFTLDSTFNDPGYCIEYGQEGLELRRPERPRGLRHGQLHPGAPALDQRRLLRDREGARRAADHRPGEELRLLLGAAARDSRQRARDQRPLQERHSSTTRRTDSQVDPGRLAFGQERASGDAAPDGDGRRGGRKRRHVMRPYVVERIVAPDGMTVSRRSPTPGERDERRARQPS